MGKETYGLDDDDGRLMWLARKACRPIPWPRHEDPSYPLILCPELGLLNVAVSKSFPFV